MLAGHGVIEHFEWRYFVKNGFKPIDKIKLTYTIYLSKTAIH